MRILHVSSVYPPQIMGGAERVVEMLAEAQAERGHSVGAAYLTREAFGSGMRHGVTVLPQRSRNLVWMEDVFRQPRALRTANKLGQMIAWRAAGDFGSAIARFRPDIVHTHSMVELPPMIWSEATAQGIRVVHTLHDYDLICSRGTLFRNGKSCDALHPSCRITGQWKARFTKNLSAVAAVSAPVLEQHRRLGLFRDLPAERTAVIWNAVQSRASTRRPARDGDFIFGFLGRLVLEKGIEPLIAACRLLPPTGWRLRIAGRAQEGDAAYRALAQGLPIDFLGFTDPQAFLDSVDLLVVPSIWREPFGLTVVEAFAHGVPVIGSRLGAITDLVGSVGEDWLVPPNDPPALAARMARALAAGRAALPPPAAFDKVLEAVSLDRMLGAYDALYERALAAQAAP